VRRYIWEEEEEQAAEAKRNLPLCQFCGNTVNWKADQLVETLVIGVGFCQFCCAAQRSHVLTHNEDTNEWTMKGDTKAGDLSSSGRSANGQWDQKTPAF
jgi:hypothetical protein